MAKKKVKKEIVERRDFKVVYRCNRCGRSNLEKKECCPGNDFTSSMT